MSEADAAGRPVGGTEDSWIRAVPGGTGTTVLALLLSRPVCLPLLHSALRRLQAAHPLLLAHLTTASPNHHFFSLTDPSSLSLLSLNASDLPPPPPATEAGISSFHAILERELNQNPWSDPLPDRLPLLFPTVYEMPDPARTVLALRFHTAVCDRTAAVAVLKELLCLMSSPGDGGPAEGLNREIEELIPRQDAWKPFWARGKDLLGYSLNALRTSTLRFEDASSHVRRSEVARLVLGADATEKLLTVSAFYYLTIF